MIGPEVNKAARLEQVHAEDIKEGTASTGDIRLSAEFRHELSSTLQRRYSRRFVAAAKNIGDLEFYTA